MTTDWQHQWSIVPDRQERKKERKKVLSSNSQGRIQLIIVGIYLLGINVEMVG
jgi:hypothetical protein